MKLAASAAGKDLRCRITMTQGRLRSGKEDELASATDLTRRPSRFHFLLSLPLASSYRMMCMMLTIFSNTVRPCTILFSVNLSRYCRKYRRTLNFGRLVDLRRIICSCMFWSMNTALFLNCEKERYARMKMEVLLTWVLEPITRCFVILWAAAKRST